ncbi:MULTISPECIES: 1-acyl-sn-glycerol-3-phosphate acyltransferase [unclassified Arthrobacter]|uniref:lysophospholipid acyltransferase family protein n=1 Tax=unclassified Arthrobacter TaxID=235627 RepID=UPI00159D1E4C|nr:MULTISPECIES: lysophospholipid acyltransferase family protein [unclassified Arthrobacter]MCQ9163201.1 1-acyl-sn-glycerol-3-phosphate acyltransferase [Arthrobacter sp. STN4]NVM98563.1 1-acyl-sn-glycerol-3-phosphate acyltransferase [Arthrobacter sp. SDTb3-6]
MSWSMRLVFAFMAGIALPIMNGLTGKEWRGLEKLPAREGFIVVPNHCTEIDPIVVGHMLYSQNIMPHFLAKDGLFRTPLLGSLLRSSGQIPVERSGVGAGKSLDVARQVLADGGAVIIYPEGTLTRDPGLWPMKGRTGAARLALGTGAKVIPVAHWGAQEVFPRYAKGFKIFPRKNTRVVVGDPVDLSAFAGQAGDKATLEAMTEVIMADITALLEGLRGEKAPGGRWDPAAHHQSMHGRFVERGAKPAENKPAENTAPGQNDAGTTETGDAR